MNTENSTAGKADRELTARLVAFVNELGISCLPGHLPEETFLPGIDIRDGGILYDPELMLSPGDLLHEAGHLAVLLPADRDVANSPRNLFGDLQEGAAEMGAIAWSWAALTHLGLAPETVFHDSGYASGSQNIIESFASYGGIGVPILQWLGMTSMARRVVAGEGPVFPQMKHWLRQ